MSRVTRAGAAGVDVGDRHQEPVAAPRERLDEPRGVRRVAEHLANLPDAEVQPLLEVHERVAAPDVIADLGAGHDLAAAAGQELEDLERLRRQLERGRRAAAVRRLPGAARTRRTAGPTGYSSKTHRELIPRPWKGWRKR